jgi:prepilin-type N-terminal cleavage/methylation domain-containing protein
LKRAAGVFSGRKMSFLKKVKGFTLIEVMVAISILVVFLLPVFGLFSMNNRRNEYNRSWSVGLDLAHNIMERILSEDVPFLAINTQGYTEGTKATGGRVQADFYDARGGTNGSDIDFMGGRQYNLKSILGAGSDGSYRKHQTTQDRIIVKHGVEYKVLFWAGIYKSDASSPAANDSYKYNADPTKELTFSYFPNPWFDVNNDCAEDNDSNDSLSAELNEPSAATRCAGDGKNRPIDPYNQKNGSDTSMPAHILNNVADPMDDRFRYGYPDETLVQEDVPSVCSSFGVPDINCPIRFEDKDFHNTEDRVNNPSDLPGDDDGGLMKVVVGLKWKGRHRHGSEDNGASEQEYYLVSFKANLRGEAE